MGNSTRGVEGAIRRRLGPFGGTCRSCQGEVLWLRDMTASLRPDGTRPKTAVEVRPAAGGPVAVDLGAGTLTSWLGPGADAGQDGPHMPHDMVCTVRVEQRRSRNTAESEPEEGVVAVCGQPVGDLFDPTADLVCNRPQGHRVTLLCKA